MQKATHEDHDDLDEHTAHETAEANGEAAANGADHSGLVATAATVAVVGVGAAVFEAALLPGLVLGVAAMWAPQYFPRLGATLHPLFRSSIRGVYKVGQKTREMMAEAQEQVHDIVAEVHAEKDADADDVAAKPAAAASVATH
jgi:hypothetical protein